MSNIVLTKHDLKVILLQDSISIGDGIMLLTNYNIHSTELSSLHKSKVYEINGLILSAIINNELSSSDKERREAKEFYKRMEEFIETCYRYPVEMGVTDEEIDNLDFYYYRYFKINKNGFIAWCRTLNLKPDFLKLLDEDSADHVVDMLVPPAPDPPAAPPGEEAESRPADAAAPETPEERRSRLQNWHKEEIAKSGNRGAIQRVAKREGISRQRITQILNEPHSPPK